MNKVKKNGGSFVKQAAILAVAGILVRLLGFLYRLPLTNMIGDEGNGIYSAGYYLYNMFLIMSSAGLPVAISKMVSEKLALGEYTNAKKIFRTSFFVAGGLGLICTIAMFLGANAFCKAIGSPRSYYCILTLAPTVFIVSVMAVFRGYFQGFNSTVPTAISQIVEQILNAVFSVYLAWILVKTSVELGAAGGTAGTGIGALAGLVTLVVIFFTSRKGREITSNLFKIAIPVITGTAIFSMTNLIDMVMVNSRLAAIGTYTAEEIDALYGQLTGKYVTLSTMPVAISTALATAVIPSIAGSVVRKEHELVQAKVDTTLRLTMIISIPAAIGLGALGPQILQMLFPNYSDGGMLIRVGSISVVFLALSQISTGVLQGVGKVNAPAWNALWGSIAKIPVNYFLIAIPEINIIGAVISTTVCYIIASLLNFRALIKATGVRPDFVGMLVKPSIASIIMGVFSLLSYHLLYKFMPSNLVCTLLAIVVAIVVFVVAMICVKGFAREDLQMVPMGGKIIRFLEKINRI